MYCRDIRIPGSSSRQPRCVFLTVCGVPGVQGHGRGSPLTKKVVELIRSWPVPTTGAELASVLGFLGYYHESVAEFTKLSEMNSLKAQKEGLGPGRCDGGDAVPVRHPQGTLLLRGWACASPPYGAGWREGGQVCLDDRLVRSRDGRGPPPSPGREVKVHCCSGSEV